MHTIQATTTVTATNGRCRIGCTKMCGRRIQSGIACDDDRLCAGHCELSRSGRFTIGESEAGNCQWTAAVTDERRIKTDRNHVGLRECVVGKYYDGQIVFLGFGIESGGHDKRKGIGTMRHASLEIPDLNAFRTGNGTELEFFFEL